MTEKSDHYQHTLTALVEGHDSPFWDVWNMQKKLKLCPDDDTTRTKLVGYYSGRLASLIRSGHAKRQLTNHLLNFVHNQPSHPIHRQIRASLLLLDAHLLRELKIAWNVIVSTTVEDAVILSNAAGYFGWDDNQRAIALLEAALKLDPKDISTMQDLAHAYERNGLDKDSVSQGVRIREDIIARRAELANYASQVSYLREQATSLLQTGDFEASEKVLREVFSMAKYVQLPPYQLHQLHQTLGSVLLAKNDINAACQELLASVSAGPVSECYMFLPQRSLAKQLLRLGRSNVVCEYLRRCTRVWSYGQIQLFCWWLSLRLTGDSDLDESTLLAILVPNWLNTFIARIKFKN